MHFLAVYQQQNTIDPNLIGGIIAAYLAILAIFYVVAVALLMIPSWFICKKAGFSQWLSLLCLIPSLGVLVLLYVLAFAEWPSQRITQSLAYAPAAPPLPPQV
jgi:hypothetical protein